MLVISWCVFYGLLKRTESRINQSPVFAPSSLVLMEISPPKCDTADNVAIDAVPSNNRFFILMSLLITSFIIIPSYGKLCVAFAPPCFLRRPLFLIFCVFKE